MENPDLNKNQRYCDIVMKGGITSGVVYPMAVVKLAKVFQLKSIGGTSAGAIAAAAAAAAQVGEQRNRGALSSGYGKLSGLPGYLAKTNASGNTNLFTFFQPQPKTRKLYESLTAGLEASGKSAALLSVGWNALLRYPVAPGLGALIGLIFFLVEIRWGIRWLGFIWLLAGIVAGVLGLIIQFFLVFAENVCGTQGGNYFGLCSGMPADSMDNNSSGPSGDGQALTVWLTKYLNELAGLPSDGDPLTFGQLWQSEPKDKARQAPADKDKFVRLEMFTTCLTKGRPFRLPFRDEVAVRENIFYFREEDLSICFPQIVIEWMKSHPREGEGKAPRPHRKVPDGFFRMPDPWNLPVVVATRMSLSFPILLSAVRLWAFKSDFEIKNSEGTGSGDAKDAASGKEERIAPCWFSDGGICSNFPIHLFDAPLPKWPTFGINLVNVPQDTPDQRIAVPWMPNSNSAGIQEAWTDLDEGGTLASLGGFLSTIIGAMQNWSDNTLASMPGYRDRIAQVGLRPSEGGLNLNMPEKRITDLTNRGTAAADEFIQRFSGDKIEKGKMNWANHRWIRFRSMIAAFEEMITSMDRTCENPEAGDPGYQTWVESIAMGEEPSYPWSTEEQRKLAIETLKALRALAVSAGDSSVGGAPRPPPELLPRPRT